MPFPPEEVTYENVTVTGEFIAGDYPGGEYIRVTNLAGPVILFGDGSDPGAPDPGELNMDIIGAGGGRQMLTVLSTGFWAGGDRGRLELLSESFDGTVPSSIDLDAARLHVTTGANGIAKTATGPVGAIVRKLELRAHTGGAIIGYVPVYDTIT